jgi:UrcA family protein
MSNPSVPAWAGFFAVLALTAAAQPVAAQPLGGGDDTVSVRIRLADLDLTGQAGAAAAFSRIKAAASEICGPAPAIVELDRVMQHRSCVQGIVGRAVSDLDAPMVTALASGVGQPSVIASNR